MNLIKNKNFQILLLAVFFLLFFKIDFRFEEGIYCCGDDYDYYAHAETISLDFDFDYSNQLNGYEDRRFNLDGKIAPKGFVGSGVLSSPFLLIGNSVDTFLQNYQKEKYIKFMNYKLLIYSFSAVSYMFFTIYLLQKCLNFLNVKTTFLELTLIYAASGVAYFAFERFSMAHVYETFSITLIIFYSFKYYLEKKQNLYAFIIPITILISLLVRLVNYYSLIVPLLISYIFKKRFDKDLYINPYFIFSTLICVGTYCFISKSIYGIVTINPQTMYGTSGLVGGFFSNESFFTFLSENIKNSLIVLFGKEFGILWFSPIIFFGLISSFLINKRINFLATIIFLLPFIQSFGAVLLWRSAASSYGFRYLYSLVPLSIIYFFMHNNLNHFAFFRKTLVIFSFFSIFSILFFETTMLTQLSTVEEMNSFGREIKYVEPEYLFGYLGAIFQVESYFKIFVTSFLGVALFKFTFFFIDVDSFVILLNKFNLPTQNEDFINYLYEIQLVSFYKILFIILYFVLLAFFLIRKDKYKANKQVLRD